MPNFTSDVAFWDALRFDGERPLIVDTACGRPCGEPTVEATKRFDPVVAVIVSFMESPAAKGGYGPGPVPGSERFVARSVYSVRCLKCSWTFEIDSESTGTP